MNKTTFKNASGLPNRAQMTTARDISMLSYKIIKRFPKKYKLFKTKKYFFLLWLLTNLFDKFFVWMPIDSGLPGILALL